MGAKKRIALALLACVIIPACDETTTIINNSGGPPGSNLPPGALAKGTLLLLSDRSTILNTTSGEPATILHNVAVAGYAAGGEVLVAIDYRPATGVLYGLTNQGRLYTVDPATGELTVVNLNPITTFTGTRFGMDFNPVTDTLRIISDADENVRVNPTTGVLIATDTNLTPSGNAYGLAYTNNFAGATTTTAYVVDQATSNLYVMNAPNTGVLTLVGNYVTSLTTQAGFDITGTNYAIIAGRPGGLNFVGAMNLTSAGISAFFNVPTNFNVEGLAIVP